MRKLRIVRWSIGLALLLAGVASPSALPLHDPEFVHPQVNVNAVTVVLLSEDNLKTHGGYEEVEGFKAELRFGATAEDEHKNLLSLDAIKCGSCRCTKHFWSPWTGQGFRHLKLPGQQCGDAVSWARNDDNGRTWTGAIHQYGYDLKSKKEAYVRLGQVAHLVGDMAQPDHVHLENHTAHTPEDHIEGWTRDNWELIAPYFDAKLTPRRFDRMEPHLTNLGMKTWQMSSFKATLKEKGFNKATGRLTEMFDVRYDVTWRLSNKWGMKGGQLGNWQGGSWGKTACERGVDKDFSDDWWETASESHWKGKRPPCGYYTLEEHDQAYPVKYKVPDGDGWKWLTQGKLPKKKQWNLSRIYATYLLPEAAEHIAGLYMHFMDVVRHPPILLSVETTQAEQCRYSRSWVIQESAGGPARVLEDACTLPAAEQWLNGNDSEVELALFFGAIDVAAPYWVKDVMVRVGSGESAVDVVVSADFDNAGYWRGVLDLPADGTFDGEQQLTVSALDQALHFEGRQFSGSELDGDPASLALASPAEPYEWAGYTSGADANHMIRVDVTGPVVELMGKDTGSFFYQCQDLTSGLSSITLAGAAKESVEVETFLVGTTEAVKVTLSIPGKKKIKNKSLHLELTDMAGNVVRAHLSETGVPVDVGESSGVLSLPTFSQADWGAQCDQKGKKAAACLRDAHFAQLFPAGLILGDPDGSDGDGHFAIVLDSSEAVTSFLPRSGDRKQLTSDFTNPGKGAAGAFAGQLAAAKLNLAVAEAGLFEGTPPITGAELVLSKGAPPPLIGMSIEQVVALSDQVLSGSIDESSEPSSKQLLKGLKTFNTSFTKKGLNKGVERL